jgi:hypothetical protein
VWGDLDGDVDGGIERFRRESISLIVRWMELFNEEG